jgi:hypothetical protein
VTKNNLARKKCYRKLAINLIDPPVTFRRPLYTCCVARVRALYPSADGKYMGFKGR